MRYIDYTVDTISIQGCSASTWHVVWSYTEFHQAAEKWAKFAVLYLEQDARDDVSGWLRRPRHPVCRLVPNTCINGDKIKYSQKQQYLADFNRKNLRASIDRTMIRQIPLFIGAKSMHTITGNCVSLSPTYRTRMK